MYNLTLNYHKKHWQTIVAKQQNFNLINSNAKCYFNECNVESTLFKHSCTYIYLLPRKYFAYIDNYLCLIYIHMYFLFNRFNLINKNNDKKAEWKYLHKCVTFSRFRIRNKNCELFHLLLNTCRNILKMLKILMFLLKVFLHIGQTCNSGKYQRPVSTLNSILKISL